MGTVAHAYNPSILGGQGRQIAWAQEFETSLGNIGRPCLYKKIQKLAGCGDVPLCPSHSGGWGRRIIWAWKVEAAVSQDCDTAFQPEQPSETLSYKKLNKWKNSAS